MLKIHKESCSVGRCISHLFPSTNKGLNVIPTLRLFDFLYFLTFSVEVLKLS